MLACVYEPEVLLLAFQTDRSAHVMLRTPFHMQAQAEIGSSNLHKDNESRVWAVSLWEQYLLLNSWLHINSQPLPFYKVTILLCSGFCITCSTTMILVYQQVIVAMILLIWERWMWKLSNGHEGQIWYHSYDSQSILSRFLSGWMTERSSMVGIITYLQVSSQSKDWFPGYAVMFGLGKTRRLFGSIEQNRWSASIKVEPL